MLNHKSGDACVACLVTVNSTLAHQMRNPGAISFDDWRELGAQQIGTYIRNSGPRETVKWYETLMQKSGGEARFTLGAMDDTLIGFAIIGGTLLCVGHLWTALDPQQPKIGNRRFGVGR
jgi:hypothetical protein